MHHERGVRILNFGSVKEREVEHLRTDFLQRLVTEIEGVLGKGSVSLGNSPWILDDEPHLRIVCNHHSIASLDGSGASVVLAIWRACRFKQWRNMEWQPLAIEWPKLAVVHTVNGKALQPACVRLTTKVFCATAEQFEPQQHHLWASPVDAKQFSSSAIPLTDNPLVERILTFQGAVVAFYLTVPRFFEMLEMRQKHEINKDDFEQILPRYAEELTLVWHQAQTELGSLQNALTMCGVPQAPAWNVGLRSVCEGLLFTAGPTESISLTPWDFDAWNDRFAFESQKLHALVADMLATLLSPPASASRLA